MQKSVLACVLSLAMVTTAFAQCGEVEVPVAGMFAIPYNQSIGIVGTPSPLPAGTYRFCGNYMVKAALGVSLANYHTDIGIDPNNIDTAPAGGSSNGHHVAIPGDNQGVVTYVEPIGCRVLTLDGNTNVYMHTVISFSPSNAVVTVGGALNWCPGQ